MAKLNMANMNTLFRKGYLLAGIVMAANMFVVNEVRATEENNKEKENITPNDNENLIPVEESNELYYFNKKYENASFLIKGVLYRVLSSENYINLIGGVISSVANNYVKWWDYNAGSYCNLRIGCLGWRTKKFFDIVQLDFNLNLGSGISWVILGTYNFIKACKANNDDEEKYIKPLYFSYLVGDLFDGESYASLAAFIAVFLIQGFVSVPLTFHISNFSISISLDSIIWMGIGKFLEPESNKDVKNKDINNLNNNIEEKMIELNDVNNEVENNNNKN